jgi:hypothetical protein
VKTIDWPGGSRIDIADMGRSSAAPVHGGGDRQGGDEAPRSIFGDGKKTKYYTYQKW